VRHPIDAVQDHGGGELVRAQKRMEIRDEHTFIRESREASTPNSYAYPETPSVRSGQRVYSLPRWSINRGKHVLYSGQNDEVVGSRS
jgi:hypothetical protein